jgi:hypothetical protein
MHQFHLARRRPTAVRTILLTGAILAVALAGTYAGHAGADAGEAGTIGGTVSTAGDPQAVTAVQVDLYDATNTAVATTQPAADGSYTFDNVAPATYTLHFAVTGDLAGDYAAEWWDNQPLQPDADPIQVIAGQLTTLADAHLDQVPLSPAPTIVGSTAVGQLLTATVGQWRPVPDSLRYQWFADGVPIPTGTSDTYLLAPTEFGKAVSLSVTAVRGGAEDITTASLPTTPVAAGTFTNTPTPLIGGSLIVGQTLTAIPGNWAPPGATFSYLWSRNGVGIPGAIGSAYRLSTLDGGARMSVTVTAAQAGYLTTPRTSAQTGPVLKLLAAPNPRLTGIARYGQVLQVLPGSWLPTGVTFRYQWYVDLKPVPAWSASSYRLPLSSIGHSVWAVVTGTKAGYAPLSKRTPSVRIAALSFTAVPTPRVIGTVRVGAVLTASMPATTPSSTIHYQWRLNGVNIPNAIHSGFRVRSTDVDRRFTVVITAIRVGYATVLRGSPYTAPAVGLAYPNCTAPTLVYPHGVARIGVVYDRVSGVNRALKGPPFFSTTLYNLNPSLDRDKDGIACER